MSELYLLNLFFVAILAAWPLWFSLFVLRLSLLNPLSIVLLLSLPVDLTTILGGMIVVDGGFYDSGYQFAILMQSILLLSQFAGAVVFFSLARHFRIHTFLPLKKLTLGRLRLLHISILGLLLFAISLLILAQSSFGIVNWLLNPREGYQFHREGMGPFYALASSSLSLSFACALFARAASVRSAIKITLLFSGLAFFLGAKSILLGIVCAGCIFLWFLRCPRLSSYLLLGMLVIYSVMIFNLFLSRGSAFQLSEAIQYFDHYKNASLYYNAFLSGEIPLFRGEILSSSFWQYVPRALVPDKPYVYGITLVNEYFFPGAAELTHTPAFGGAVNEFADFGFFGVFLFGFFSVKSLSAGVLSWLVFFNPGLKAAPVSFNSLALFLILYVPSFGLFLPLGLYLIMFVFLSVAFRLRFAPRTFF